MSPSDLTELLEVARDRNQTLNVTGMLLYAQRSFMQQLEGEAAAVREVYASIEADPRHTDIRLLSDRPLTTPRFSGWSMGFDHPEPDSLRLRLPGYRTPRRSPLVDPALVHDTEMAEALLGLYAEDLVS